MYLVSIIGSGEFYYRQTYVWQRQRENRLFQWLHTKLRRYSSLPYIHKGFQIHEHCIELTVFYALLLNEHISASLILHFSNINVNWQLLQNYTLSACHIAFQPWAVYNSLLSCWQGYDLFHTSLFIKIICTCAPVLSHFKAQLLTNSWPINFIRKEAVGSLGSFLSL